VKKDRLRYLGVLAFLIYGASQANAALTLTAAGTAQGFNLSTFATGFPNASGLGPLGIAFPAAGGVLIADIAGNIRRFPTDTDGQSAVSAPIGQNYGSNNAVGLAVVGGNIYMTQQLASAVVQVNNDGTFNQTIVSSGVFAATGIVANPFTGHLYVSTIDNGQIVEVDPVAKTTSILGHYIMDGMTLSADGKTLYGATYADVSSVEGGIVGIDTTTGLVKFDTGIIPGGVDGAALGTGTLAGLLFVNMNSGDFIEVNLNTLARTTIATGGSRGDFVTVDPNGSLLLTQSDSIVRLTPPAGGGFVGGPVPEPSSLIMFGLLFGGFLGWRQRR
jgi:hypothetical protein